MFRKFVTANLLNLLGLSLAFASFFVIMTQVSYDLGYNKSFTEHEKLFRLTLKLGPGMEDYGVTLPRPLVEQLGGSVAAYQGLWHRRGLDKSRPVYVGRSGVFAESGVRHSRLYERIQADRHLR